MVICPNCNKELPENSLFCNACGTKIETEELVNNSKDRKRKGKSKNTKIVIALALLFTVVITGVICLIFLLPEKEIKPETDFVFYVKENEIFVTDMKTKDVHTQITTQLINTTVDEDYLGEVLSEGAGFSKLNNDESLFFFTDKLTDEFYGCNLYYRELENLDAPVVKIDSSVCNYVINDSGNLVTYTKYKNEQTRTLYQFSLDSGEKDKICEDIYEFYVSDDGSRIIYSDGNKNLYMKDAGKDREKLAVGISYIEEVSNDFTVVYYIKDDAFYKQVIGEDRVKIASDVCSVVRVFDSGEIYYSKIDEIKICLMDYINDDLWETDCKINMPEEPVYPDFDLYSTIEEYNLAVIEYEAKYEQYRQDYYAYVEKSDRDYYREQLSEMEITYTRNSLYFYNGKEEIKVSENFGRITDSLTPVVTYITYTEPEKNSISFSSVIEEAIEGDVCDIVTDKLYAVVYSVDEAYLCIKDQSTLIDYKTANEFYINDDGTIVYFMSDSSNEISQGDLYVIYITDGIPSTPELYDSDVYRHCSTFISNDRFLYFKNGADYLGDMYVNKEMIDFDVLYYWMHYEETDDTLYYIVDYSETTESGTLKRYENGETVKIADDVAQYYVDNKGRVIYLYDYSVNYGCGELYEWYKGETEKIDSDVFFCMPKKEIKN